jgi:hypothetical protein
VVKGNFQGLCPKTPFFRPAIFAGLSFGGLLKKIKQTAV